MTYKIRGQFSLSSTVGELVAAWTMEVNVCSTDLGCELRRYP